MTMRPLGRTGLQVSPFSLGSMEFGGQVDESTAADLVATSLDAGINAIDTPMSTPAVAARSWSVG